MNTQKKTMILVFVIFGIIAVIAIVFGMTNNENNSKNSSPKTEIKKEQLKSVINHSRFTIVNDCINKFYGYIQTKDYEKSVGLLQNSYVDSNNITASNIESHLNIKYYSYSYLAEEMYYIENEGNVLVYYVKGFLINETMDADFEKEERYFEVYLDQNNLTFSLNPYDGGVFSE